MSSVGRLTDFASDGSNPGALGARMYVPADLPAGAPLVVVLHGCTQTAEGYDAGTGWSRLADRGGFALLFPEQRRANNANLCFNWFEAADIARRGGEAESIAQMVKTMIERHALDRQRIFVTGLSAGGAMAAVMLATYPDLFAGGAIIGGLPFGCAQGVGAALERMRRNRGGGQASVDAIVRASGGTSRRWPTVSIWHGSADRIVTIGNMDALATQWCGIHGVDRRDAEIERGATWERRRWSVGERSVVETWCIAGMGHGVPIGPEGLGSVGPYMLAADIDSTTAIARSWDLLPATGTPAIAEPRALPTPSVTRPTQPASGIQAVIEDALRSAGLMK